MKEDPVNAKESATDSPYSRGIPRNIPVFLQEDWLCRGDETRLSVVGRVQDLSRVFVGRGNDNEAREKR
jgi:hypothetical protein